MRKCLSIFLIFVLLLGLFSACSAPNPLADLLDQLSEMEGYVFTAVGEVRFTSSASVSDELPRRYEIQGTRSAAGALSGTITYADAEGIQFADVSLVHTNGSNYAGFLPLFQHLMDQIYAPYTTLPLRDTFTGAPEFTGSPYLTDPALRFENLPIDFPALISSLDNRYVQEALMTDDSGLYSLSLSGDQLSPHVLTAVAAPFTLYSDLLTHGLQDEVSDPVLEALLLGDRSTYTLELAFTMDEEGNVFTMWLTLQAPNLMTITADATYRAHPSVALAPPYLVFDIDLFHTLLADYHEIQALLVLLERHDLEVIYDLPELHMTMHEATDLLIPFYLEVGESDEIYSVSVMYGASNTSANGFVHSFTPAMSLLYTTLDTSSASATMAPFVLEDLGLDAYDAENFERTAMRVNAHDTAAVKALYFDDNLVGRTLHIYVLQNIDDSDSAIFLAVTIMLDHFTAHAYAVLEELGFLIGIDLLEYVELAQQ